MTNRRLHLSKTKKLFDLPYHLTKKVLRKAKTALYESVYAAKLELNLDKPIFTFTFDDVPINAVTKGAPILEANDIHGTFYVSHKFEKNKCFASEDEVIKLHDKGHHIGCHTFSHNVRLVSTIDKLKQDCAQNRKWLSGILGGIAIRHFAYPGGAVSFSAKKVLPSFYETMRSTRPGINFGTVDLSLLRVIELYSNNLIKERIREYITKNSKIPGWLIFYTHDVKENPSAFGVTPEDLSWAIKECQNANGEILSIEQAYSRITASCLDKG